MLVILDLASKALAVHLEFPSRTRTRRQGSLQCCGRKLMVGGGEWGDGAGAQSPQGSLARPLRPALPAPAGPVGRVPPPPREVGPVAVRSPAEESQSWHLDHCLGPATGRGLCRIALGVCCTLNKMVNFRIPDVLKPGGDHFGLLLSLPTSWENVPNTSTHVLSPWDDGPCTPVCSW